MTDIEIIRHLFRFPHSGITYTFDAVFYQAARYTGHREGSRWELKFPAIVLMLGIVKA